LVLALALNKRDMDVTLKYKIVEKIIQSNDDVVLNKIKSLLGIQDKDFWHGLSSELKQHIDKAKEEMDNGKGIAHMDVLSEVDKLIG